jgi:hypothetical protein
MHCRLEGMEAVPTKVLIAISATITACSLPLHAQPRAGPPIPLSAHIEVPPDGASIPMQVTEGWPVIEMRINGKGPYRFILDTGASITVISKELSRELELTASRESQSTSASGPAPPPTVVMHEVRLGGVVLKDLIAAVAPAGMLSKSEEAPRGALTAASVPGYLLTYDYPGKRISIKKGTLQEADSKSIFQYREDQILPTIRLRICGRDAEVHLDTGSPFGLTLPVKFLTDLPLVTEPKVSGKVRTGGGGEFPVSVARLGCLIELGKYRLDADEVRFSDARPGLGPATGNIGYEILRHFAVIIDSKNRRIQLDQ